MDTLVVKFWAKAETMEDYQFLVELSLNLRSLQYIGKSVGLPSSLPNPLTNLSSMAFINLYLLTALSCRLSMDCTRLSMTFLQRIRGIHF